MCSLDNLRHHFLQPAQPRDEEVRGLLYEAAGSVDPALLAAGAETVQAACDKSEIPHALLSADPADHDAWLAAALAAIDELLAFERA